MGYPTKAECCCFTGHRFLKSNDIDRIRRDVRLEAEQLIVNRGVKYFGNGAAIGFDMLAAEVILELREKYPQIKLIMVVPCRDQDRRWRREDQEHYHSLLRRADKIRVLYPSYNDHCMHDRNRHLVDNSAYCIAYLRNPSSGTQYTVNYARQLGLRIIRV